jgi:hypothetical protein
MIHTMPHIAVEEGKNLMYYMYEGHTKGECHFKALTNISQYVINIKVNFYCEIF